MITNKTFYKIDDTFGHQTATIPEKYLNTVMQLYIHYIHSVIYDACIDSAYYAAI